MEKEERTSYVSFYVTPSVKKELDNAKSNDELKDKIIKDFVTSETNWLKEDMKEIDDISLRYRAKLLTIKDNFNEAQTAYVEEIYKMQNNVFLAFEPIKTKFTNTAKEIENTKNEIINVSKLLSDLQTKLSYVDYSRLETLLNAVDRFNKMSETEKKLIEFLLTGKTI